MNILVHSSYIRRRDMDAVLNCLVTDQLGAGDFYDRFVKSAKERFSFEYGLFLRSPMIALEAALNCLGLEQGDAVALSALSKAWAGKVLKTRGYNPVWLDVDEYSSTISQKSIETMGPNVKALYLDSAWGIMPNPSLFENLSIPIIEDISSTVGAVDTASKKTAGGIGSLVILGLEPSASITAGAGALLYSNQRRIAQVLRNHYSSLLPEELALDMNAALAISQLKDLDKFLEKKRELSALYTQSLARAHKRCLQEDFECEASNFGCVVVFDTGIKDIRDYAKKKDVDTVMAFDGSCIGKGFVEDGLCPIAASLLNRAVAFPLNQRISKTAALKISKVLATLP